MGAAVADADCGFDVEYRLADGVPQRSALAGCAGVRLEDAAAIRGFHFGKGQRSFAGWWWLATTGRHVGHESFVERDHVMLLDFDPDVTGVAAQPMARPMNFLKTRTATSPYSRFYTLSLGMPPMAAGPSTQVCSRPTMATSMG